jgi:hypothetical protein
MAITALTVAIVSAVVAVLALVIAALSVRETRRGADASERGARAAEEENEILKNQLAEERERQSPRVELHVLRSWHLGSDREHTSLAVRFVVENRSREPETLRDVAVEFEGRVFSTTGTPELRGHSDSGPRPRLVPQRLGGEERLELQAELQTRRIQDADRLPAALVATCVRAGLVRTSFTIYQP